MSEPVQEGYGGKAFDALRNYYVRWGNQNFTVYRGLSSAEDINALEKFPSFS